LQLTGEDSVDTLGSGVVGIREIQSLLGSDEQLVEFFTLRDEVLAFVLDRHRVRTVRGLASRTEVIEQVDRLRFQWSKFAPGDYADRNGADLLVSTQKVLRNLYEMLMEPLADLLTSTRLIVAPYGALHGVPFHALFDGEKYALDRWEFAYTPSGAVWHACRIRGEGKAVKSLLLGVSEPNIAHVRDEVAALGALLPEARVCLDEAAALSAIPADAEFRYIHFATHGVFRKDNPLFSALRLSDGWLIAHDLCRRRLDCSVATLSACRTGLSAVAPGDEVLGLVWGFLHAGARAVLVSLWTADDAATADLMRDFYAGLTHGKGRAQSLRDAQWALRKRYPHPYHWAAFALVGAS
jgi:CHAT domain-containing protein